MGYKNFANWSESYTKDIFTGSVLNTRFTLHHIASTVTKYY